MYHDDASIKVLIKDTAAAVASTFSGNNEAELAQLARIGQLLKDH